MIKLCTVNTTSETFREFRVFVFIYRTITENAESAEDKIGVIFD